MQKQYMARNGSIKSHLKKLFKNRCHIPPQQVPLWLRTKVTLHLYQLSGERFSTVASGSRFRT